MDVRQRRGRAGEQLARSYLEANDWRILETNHRSRYGELDIIAIRDDIVAFVEVKARRGRQFGEPYEAVGPRKQAQVRRMAQMWLAAHERDRALQRCRFRFDVISIVLDASDEALEFVHLEDAFR